MKKFLLLLIMISVYNILISQNTNAYMEYVNEAELALSDSNWNKALSMYSKAISIKKNNSFSTDIHNALVCAVILNRYKSALAFSKMLVIKGCSLDYFDKDVFIEFKESKEWRRLLKKELALKDLHNKSINIAIKNIIDSMYLIDQDKSIIDKKNIFNENALRLKEIIELNGYPSENITGVHLEHNKFFIDKVSVMIYHLLSYARDDISLMPLLYEKAKAGEIHPCYFAWLPFKEKKYQVSISGNNVLTIVDSSIYVYTPQIRQLKEYNKHRKEINLPDLETFKKITLFYYKDKRFIYPVDGRITKIDFANEGSKISYLKDYKKL